MFVVLSLYIALLPLHVSTKLKIVVLPCVANDNNSADMHVVPKNNSADMLWQ